MKAVILVGGFGTRLRPLTINCPKSIVPFINRAMVSHQIQALAKVGVQEIILAINYQAQQIKADLQPLQKEYKIKIIFSKQPEPYGTAGPLKYAQEILTKDNKDGLVFVFNSDIICDYPLQELLKFHKSHSGLGSIVLAKVQDPSRFGVVVTNPQNGQVNRFVEKPKHYISNLINAGIYLLDLKILSRIPVNKKCMIQRQIFPNMAQNGELFSINIKSNFWFDIGKPSDYLHGQNGFLEYYNIKDYPTNQYQSLEIVGNVLIHPSVKISKNCKIGPNVVIGPNVIIGQGNCIKNSTILKDTKIGNYCFIENTIISWQCDIGNWIRIEGLSVIAENVSIKSEIRITEGMILSHKALTENVERTIVMF